MSKDSTWVDELPDLDKQALHNLVGGDLSRLPQPRTMVYCLYDIDPGEQLEKVSKQLSSEGWDVNSFNDPDQPHLYVIEAKKDNYVIDKKAYLNDTAFFIRMAKDQGIHYDGWYASQ